MKINLSIIIKYLGISKHHFLNEVYKKDKSSKKSISCVLVLVVLCTFFSSCKNESTPGILRYIKLSGKTMGTTYNITYADSLNQRLKKDIDQLLIEVNQDMSTYIDNSTISIFNKRIVDSMLLLKESSLIDIAKNPAQSVPRFHFYKNFRAAKKIYEKTNGYFDPTILPLASYWGFSSDNHRAVTAVDSIAVDSLLRFVGFDKTLLSKKEDGIYLSKLNKGVQLDFNAIAKGYGVDVIAQFLERKGLHNFLVEIGGEVRAKGKNAKNKSWTIGINRPDENASLNDFEQIIGLENKALATSGNYRNFREVDGVKYGHTINTTTGFPELNNLLSASVLADNCMTADAYATAFMAMGFEKAFSLASKMNELEAFFIYSDEEGNMQVKYTIGLVGIVKE